MVEIVYTSCATQAMSRHGLVTLLDEARDRNAREGVTGMLLYSHSSFLQLLEGPYEAVDAVYASIERDARHTDLRLLSRRSVDERRFPDWTMSFRHPGDVSLAENLSGYQPGTEHPFADPDLVLDAVTAEALLSAYAVG